MLNGSVHPDFERTAKTFLKQVPSGPGGAALCVYHRGEKVVDCWAGTRNLDGDPWEEDTLSLSYSTSKGVASTLLHMLVDRGLLDYDDPVAAHWPEFAQGGKAEITIRQVMCHEAGLYSIRQLVDHAHRMLDWEYMVEALGDAVPLHRPGKAHGYHGLTYGWLVGELIQRVTGKSFSDLLASEIAEPLGLDGLFIGLPKRQMKRRATLIPSGLVQPGGTSAQNIQRWSRGINRFLRLVGNPVDLEQVAEALLPTGMDDLDFDSEEFLRVPVPAANGMFTARSLAKLYATLANDGELGGVRLLSRDTLWRATEVQNRGIGRVIPIPMHWRLGYHRVATLGASVPAGFGHSGFGGSGAWADPDRELSVALTLNSGVGTPFGDLRIIRIGTAALRCAEAR
ncbi:MAG: serine hydrolase domain-containing protein [Myxococcota bacterium]